MWDTGVAPTVGGAMELAASPTARPPSTEPSTEQKLFLVVSVALATVCFFTNAIQVGVLGRPAMLRNVRNLLLLSQTASGLLSSFVAAFPIHVISLRGSTPSVEESYNACYLGHSGLILLVMMTSLSGATLLLIYQNTFGRNQPHRYSSAAQSIIGWGEIIVILWVLAFTTAILPWSGWNTWVKHDAHCHLSTLWPLSFTAFITFLVGLHVAIVLLLWAVRRGNETVTQSSKTTDSADNQDTEAVPIASTGRLKHCSNVGLMGWAISIFSVLPLLTHVIFASSCSASKQCMASPRHYHEDEASLPWTSLLLTAAAVLNPLLYIFSDDQLSSSTLQLLSRICCCCWKRCRKEATQPQPQRGDVHTSNDTDQLVDNT